jgi:transcriptional regulator with XRE-family HTH domain
MIKGTVKGSFDGGNGQLGHIIASLRNKRNLSRAKLISRVLPLLEDTPFAETMSEAWLKRLESGEVVKIPTYVIHALCQALKCSDREYSDVLLVAGRNVLSDDGEDFQKVNRLLNYFVYSFKEDGFKVLSDLLEKDNLSDLDDKDIYVLVRDTIDMVLKHKRHE